MRIFWALLGLCTPVILLYTQFLGNPLIFDDARFFYSEEFSVYLHKLFSLNFRWFSLATFVWTRQLLGDALIWLHLGNLLLHLLNTATLFFFLRRLFELVMPVDTDNKTLSPFWLAFFGALIFALHPVSVYAVAYLIQRTTLMATLFTLLTWRLFLEGLMREQRRWLIASAFTYFLAVLSKEHAIMAPAVTVVLLILVSKQPLQRIKLVWSTFVLYALIAVFVVFQRQSEHILGQAYEPVASAILSGFGDDFDKRFVYPLSILTQCFVFFKYLWMWLVPSPKLMSIDICQMFSLRFWSFPELLGAIGFVLYPIIAIRLLLKKGLQGLLGFALLCPWLLFFTEIATVRVQEIIVLYRSYLWMVGFFASLPFLCQRMTAKQSVITLGGIALLMMALAWFRLTTFSHPLLLWDDAARRIKDDKSCPMGDRILNNRGIELMRLERYSEAIDDFNRAIKEGELQKTYTASYYNRGIAHLQIKQFQLALDDFNAIDNFNAISVEPTTKQWQAFYFYKAQAIEGLLGITAARPFYEKACSNGMLESCEKLKKLEASTK